MNPTTPITHCLDDSFRDKGGRIDLDTPAGPLTMTLPPRLSDGQTLRLAGRGELGPDGKRGDVLLTVSFFTVAGSTPPPAVAIPQSPEAAPVRTLTPVAPTNAHTAPVLAARPVPDDPPDELPPFRDQGTDPIIEPSATAESGTPVVKAVAWSGREYVHLIGWIVVIGGIILFDHLGSPAGNQERQRPPAPSRVMCFPCKGQGTITRLSLGQIVKTGCPSCLGAGSRPASRG